MKITKELEVKIQEYKDICIKNLYNGVEWENYNPEDTHRYIEYIYNMAGYKKPAVFIANNISEYKNLYQQIFVNKNYEELIENQYAEKNGLPLPFATPKIGTAKKRKETVNSHYLYIASEYARVYLMWYKFIKDEFKKKCTKAAELDWLYDNVRKSSIAKCFFEEKVVLVLRLPKLIHRNEVGFHNPKGFAIDYGTEGYYYLNGRETQPWIFEKYQNGTLKLSDMQNCKNDEDKGAIVTLIKENEGNEGLLKFLGADLVDEQVVNHRPDYSEVLRLYRTKMKFPFARDANGKTNVQLAWFEEKCPSTGQTYLLETWPNFQNVLDAAKFHRPSKVPKSITYNWKLFSN